jgi:hypothetical protein
MGRPRAAAVTAVTAAGGYALAYRLGQTWGATEGERRASLPGDELLPDAATRTTHAITIDAAPHEVWPWLVQMGWGRAGWYTYRWVDQLLFPANGPSADRILPEHQRLQVGDRIPDGPPEADCWFTVERFDANRTLVLRSTTHVPAAWREHRDIAMDWVWSWHLTEPAFGRTRLVQRNRIILEPTWFELAFLAVIVPADFLMARSHLRGIRRRVRHAAVPV